MVLQCIIPARFFVPHFGTRVQCQIDVVLSFCAVVRGGGKFSSLKSEQGENNGTNILLQRLRTA